MLSCSVVIGRIVIDIFGNGGGVVYKTAGLDGAESGAVHSISNLSRAWFLVTDCVNVACWVCKYKLITSFVL